MKILLSDIEKTIPKSDTSDYRSLNADLFSSLNKTCIVIDDDPTGNQTVHDIALLTEWDVDTIRGEFEKKTPVFFILTNSRSLSSTQSTQIYREIAANIREASVLSKRKYTIVSRSDSTLRGHFSTEIEAIQDGGDFNEGITVCIPVMFEGGRVTVNDIHYICENEVLTPVNKTPFAKDHSFGYTKANLTEYIEEKTNGKIKAAEVISFSLEQLRTQELEALSKQIINIKPNRYCIFNAIDYNDLDKVTHALLLAESKGKKILYRTSSSFVPSYIGLPPKGLLATKDMGQMDAKKGGVIIVGSYVPKSSAQLDYLLGYCDPENTIEVNVNHLINKESSAYLQDISSKIDQKIDAGKNVVIYTSRKIITGADMDSNVNIGATVSKALVTILRQTAVRPKYVLAKGGITSHDLAIKGLGMKNSKVIGQINSGVPVWQMGEETKFPNLPYIVFPGNVGTKESLYQITQKLS